MKQLPLLLLSLFVCGRAPAAACFDSFADSTGSGGTAYTVGSYLFGQVNSQDCRWYALTNTPTPPATGLPVIAGGSLIYPGLPTSSGNCIFVPSAPGVMGRLTLNFTATSGTVYYSFLLKVVDLSGVDTSGTQNNFLAAFGDTTGNQNATLLRGATRLYTRRSGAGFNLGVARNTSTPSDWVFDSTVRSTNQVLFIVGAYNYTAHTASLWINPSGSTFGSNAAPAATITATAGADLNSGGIHAFVLGGRTNAPPGCYVDELRIGTSWSIVTGGLDVGTQPTNQTLNAGATATFTALGSGIEPIGYQWRKNGVDLSDGGRISGTASGNLSISNITQLDAGSYTVKITNSSSAVTSAVAVLMVVDPSINTQPTAQVVPAGATATFQVSAGGVAPLSYQWYKNGAILSNGGNLSGAQTAALTISNATSGDIGSYSVRVQNGVGGSITSSAAALLTTDPAIPTTRPNVIFILCDDLGYGDMGFLYQNGRIASLPRETTPNLDTLASEGMQLRRHYCGAPVCAPSRASLFSGVHQGHANVHDEQWDKAIANNHTLGTVMRSAGYATALIGKWGLGGDDVGGTTPADWAAYPTKRGFDYFYGYERHGDGHEHYPKEALYSNGSKQCYDGTNNVTSGLDKCYTADLFTARAKKWIVDQRNGNPNQPFFLFLAYDTPHAAYELPTQAYPAGGGVNGGLQWLGTPGQMINTASGTVDSYIPPDYLAATYDDDNNPATAQVPYPEIFRRYATGVRRIDEAVGDIKKLLQDLAIDTNTVVVFTSDNGPTVEDYLSLTPRYAGNFFDTFGPLDGVKRDTWEGGIRMPTVVRWPGKIPAGTTNQTPSQFQDWMPTFTELAGLPGPARSDGVSLLPTLLGTGTQRPSTIYVEYEDIYATPTYAEFEPSHRGRVHNQMQVIGLNGYQGVRYDIQSQADNFEIYDTLNDPKQITNLASLPSFATLQQQMKDRVLQVRRPDATTPRPYDSEYVPAIGPLAVTNGLLNFACYEGVWPWVPDISRLSVTATGSVAGLSLAGRSRDTNYAIAFTGYIRVPEDGDYTFYLNTDAGAELRLHDATVIDDDFLHVNGGTNATIRLKAGLHPLRLTYRHTSGTNVLDLKYSGPNISKQPVPLSALYAACPLCIISPSADDDDALTMTNTPVMIDVLANDTDDGVPSPLSIVSVSTPLAGSATIVSNQVRYVPNPGFLGQDTFTYVITDGAAQATATVRVQVAFADGSYWFPFNETGGIVAPDAGGYYTAQLQGYPNDPAQWVAGRYNRALTFDGESNYVTIPGFTGILGTAPRTCAAWIKTTATANVAVMGWGVNSSGNKWSFLSQAGNARLEVTGGWVQGTRLINDGQWHHVACTFQNDGTPDATDVKLYVDGTLEPISSSQSVAINTLGGGLVTIGDDVQDRFFFGTIDEVHIYNRALSAGEISALYQSQNQSAEAWFHRYFDNAPLNWNTDDDGDGESRLGEYAFGGEPLISDPDVRRFMPEIVANHLRIHFHRRAAGTHELTYQVQSSTDLSHWSPLAGVEISSISSALAGFDDVIFEATALISGTGPMFVRLSALLP